MPDGVLEVRRQHAGIDVDDRMPHSGVGGHLTGDGAFVVTAALERQGEGIEFAALVLAHQAQHHGRVDAAAQVDADRNVRAQPHPHGVREPAAELLDGLPVAANRGQTAACRVVEIPVAVDRGPSAANPHEMPRGDTLHVAEQCVGAVAVARLVLENHGRVPAARHAHRQQRLDLRSDEESVRVVGVEQRFDTEPIPGHEHLAQVFVPQREGELAAQVLEAGVAVFQVQRDQNLAVGFRAETIPRLLEVTPDGFESIELAVDHRANGPVRAGQRLLAAVEVDDAEPYVAEAAGAVAGDPRTAAIGAAMVNRPIGGAQELRERPRRLSHHGRDATHGLLLSSGIGTDLQPRRRGDGRTRRTLYGDCSAAEDG